MNNWRHDKVRKVLLWLKRRYFAHLQTHRHTPTFSNIGECHRVVLSLWAMEYYIKIELMGGYRWISAVVFFSEGFTIVADIIRESDRWLIPECRVQPSVKPIKKPTCWDKVKWTICISINKPCVFVDAFNSTTFVSNRLKCLLYRFANDIKYFFKKNTHSVKIPCRKSRFYY